MADFDGNPYAPPDAGPHRPLPPRQAWGIRPINAPRFKGAVGALIAFTLLLINYAFVQFQGEFYPVLLVLGLPVLFVSTLLVVVGQPYADSGLPRPWFVVSYWFSFGLGLILGLGASFLLMDF